MGFGEDDLGLDMGFGTGHGFWDWTWVLGLTTKKGFCVWRGEGKMLYCNCCALPFLLLYVLIVDILHYNKFVVAKYIFCCYICIICL